MQSFYTKVYELVKRIPYGKVTTYGDIAKALGNSRASRAVGYALHKNPEPDKIPCYRVVNREGYLADSFAFGGAKSQQQLLEKENVVVINNRVNLDEFGFKFINE